MKNVILSIGLLLTGASSLYANCDQSQAEKRGREVAVAIAKANNFDVRNEYLKPMREDEAFFYVGTAFDLGLSVPVYTVKVSKYDCQSLDVVYSNDEG